MKIIQRFSHKISLGQNFLINHEVIRRTVEAGCIMPSDVVLEIGPGQGALTRELLASSCAFLHSLEIDRRLEPWLLPLQNANEKRFRIIWADAMQTSFRELSPRPNKILANIPYNITTALIWKAIEELTPQNLELLILMVQKEAAERLTAPPHTKERYPLGVTLELIGTISKFMQISPGSFNPPPKVSSSLIAVRIERNRQLVADSFWSSLLGSAFAQRRKTLINNLLSAGFEKETLTQSLTTANIPLNARAEELSSPQWLELYSILSAQRQQV